MIKLYKKDKNGVVRWWSISHGNILENPGELRIEYGIEGGKTSVSIKNAEPKNVGKANETDAYAQAIKEMGALIKKQIDKGYVEDTDDLHDATLLPMLAQDFHKSKHRIKYPALIQPKLNGIRCFAVRNNDTIMFFSRRGNKYTTLDHMIPTLLGVMDDGAVLDGEIYHHGWSLQRISSAIKKQSEDSALLQYWVFDTFIPNTDCETRLAILQNTLGDPSYLVSPVRFIYTNFVDSEEQVIDFTKQAIEEGFEGGIVRNTSGLYDLNVRSENLQKVKFMQDKEYTIVSHDKEHVQVPVGIDPFYLTPKYQIVNGVIWVCVTEDGKTFKVRPKGTTENRREWYKNAKSYYGKMLTVKFQELSDDGIPIFPVGVGIRDYE